MPKISIDDIATTAKTALIKQISLFDTGLVMTNISNGVNKKHTNKKAKQNHGTSAPPPEP